MRSHRLSARPGTQRGAALLTAMIIVTLVATLATSMVWQQWRAVQVETAERARAQAGWILSGALDFARRILREDRKAFTGLTEPWATPLAESRLSTFLAADNTDTDSGPEAFLSGTITDAQSRYNVSNLASGNPTDTTQLQIMERLCRSLGLDVSIAQRIATGLRQATAPKASGAAPLAPQTVAQLSWLGIDAGAIQALQPYIVVLPRPTRLNVNTASKEVLAAVLNVDHSTAERLVQIAQRTPFIDIATTFSNQFGGKPPPNLTVLVDTVSDYFEVRGRLRLADHVLVERSLLQRDRGTRISTVLQRERIASLDQSAS